jgi:hypothetical protein
MSWLLDWGIAEFELSASWGHDHRDGCWIGNSGTTRPPNGSPRPQQPQSTKMHPLTVSPLLLIDMFVEMLKASLPELEQVATHVVLLGSWHQMLHVDTSRIKWKNNCLAWF